MNPQAKKVQMNLALTIHQESSDDSSSDESSSDESSADDSVASDSSSDDASQIHQAMNPPLKLPKKQNQMLKLPLKLPMLVAIAEQLKLKSMKDF